MLRLYREVEVRNKLHHCLRLSRESSRDFRETKDTDYIKLKKEVLSDARYWWEILKKLEVEND